MDDATPDALTPTRWTAARVARPVRDLDRSAAFYRDMLGLPPRGGFTGHDGYDAVFFALPGGTELELTAGHSAPHPGTDEDLLVLYVPSPDDVRQRAAELVAAGVPPVPSANPYWNRWGQTFLDPDGYAVVIAAVETDPAASSPAIRIELHTGRREDLRGLFELAEDSAVALDSYLSAGRVLVAVSADEVIGHLQVVDTGRTGQAEITNMAVREDRQGCGIGARLVRAAAGLVAAEGGTGLLGATAAADVGNLRFYQRQGFRMRGIERDAFTPHTGYPPGLRIDGIDLRDRVWLDRTLGRSG